MTTDEALKILDAGTNPSNAGKLTRIDYAHMQMALECLAAALKPKESADEPVSK